MPMDRSKYPDDWEAISARIREREGNRCKWCGVANGAIGYRLLSGEFVKIANSADEVGLEADALALDGYNVIRIVLTVAHLGVAKPDGTPGDKHDKMDVRDENLAALCQKCHLNYDRDDHVRNAAETRRRRRIDGGQMVLIDG